MALWKFGHFKLVSKISVIYWLDIKWSADRDEQITWLNFKKNSYYFSGVIAFWKFGHVKLVSKISRKLFEIWARGLKLGQLIGDDV